MLNNSTCIYFQCRSRFRALFFGTREPVLIDQLVSRNGCEVNHEWSKSYLFFSPMVQEWHALFHITIRSSAFVLPSNVALDFEHFCSSVRQTWFTKQAAALIWYQTYCTTVRHCLTSYSPTAHPNDVCLLSVWHEQRHDAARLTLYETIVLLHHCTKQDMKEGSGCAAHLC